MGHIDVGLEQDPQLLTPMHIHNDIEFLYVTNGNLSCKTGNGQDKILGKGDIAIFNGDFPHETLASRNAVYYSINFPLEFYMLKLEPDTVFLPFLYKISDCLYLNESQETGSQLISQIISLHKLCSAVYTQSPDKPNIIIPQSPPPGHLEYLFAEIFRLIGFLKRINFIRSIGHSHNKAFERLLPALQYISENIKEPISLIAVAKAANLAPSYLCRLFKKVLGYTIVEYVNFLRLSEAQKTVISTDKSITQIAMEFGFSSATYFIRLFKKQFLVTPNAYRQFKKASSLTIELDRSGKKVKRAIET